MNELLSVKNLNIYSPSHHLIHGIDLKLFQNKVNVLIGESGSGKSVTAKSLLQALPPNLTVSYDTFCFNGQDVTSIKLLLGRHIGYISQDYTHSFNAHISIGKQLIAIYRQHYAVSKQQAKAKVQQALGWVGLDHIDMMKRYRFSLSGGQLERVLIASVMMLDPSLIIADEPTAALDVVTGYQMMDLLHHLADKHEVTLLIITHNLTHVLQFSDYIYVLREGHIVDEGSKALLQRDDVSDYTRELFQRRSQLKRGDAHA